MIHLDVGSHSEACILSQFVKHDIKVYVCWQQNSRSDMIIDINSNLFRVQCKTAWAKSNGSIVFNTCSCTAKTKRSYNKETDLFAVYYQQLNKVYILPVNIVPNKNMTLRIFAPKNGQISDINWAEDYELKKWIKRYLKPVA